MTTRSRISIVAVALAGTPLTVGCATAPPHGVSALTVTATHSAVDRAASLKASSDPKVAKLSQQRANRVRDDLVDAGVDTVMLTAVGVGEEEPVADNSTPEARKQATGRDHYQYALDRRSTIST